MIYNIGAIARSLQHSRHLTSKLRLMQFVIYWILRRCKCEECLPGTAVTKDTLSTNVESRVVNLI